MVTWRFLNPHQYRLNLLKYYYKNRVRINLMFSKPKEDGNDDVAQTWIDEHYNL